MKNTTMLVTATSFIIAAMGVLAACSKNDNESSVDCSTLNAHISRDEAAYASGPSADKCLVVVGDYNEYINGNCPDKDDYVKDLNAFKAAHNNCQ